MSKSFRDLFNELPRDRKEKINKMADELNQQWKTVYRYNWTYNTWSIKGRVKK